jgi:molybdopterin-guanine dinucleotide biosynthesis protein B
MAYPPLLGFAAYSGTGKTTLLTKLIPLLQQIGVSTGVIKHSHHDFEIDYPGKDSYQLRIAGASPVMIVSSFRSALITEFKPKREICLQEQLAAFPTKDLDLILVEGFRHEAFAKIELHRPILGKPLLYPQDSNIIAIASDAALETPSRITLLDLNNPPLICNFIINQFLSNHRDRNLLPPNS